jgi:hypothetical protein
MAKTLLSMQDLNARALAEIRKQPGCSNVCNIVINRVTDERAENNWSLCVPSAGTADVSPAARAALYVQHALRHDYDLNSAHASLTISQAESVRLPTGAISSD